MSSQDGNIHALLLTVTQQLVTWLAWSISRVIDVIHWSSDRFPQATRVVEGVVITYILWRSYVRIMKIWWKLCVFLVKMGLFYLVVFVLLGSYMRGMETFFLKDTKSLWGFANHVYKTFSEKDIRYIDPTSEEDPFLRSVLRFSKDNKDTLDAVENQYHEMKGHAEDYLKRNNLENTMPDLRNIHALAANWGLL